MPLRQNPFPPFKGDIADFFILGLLHGSVHGELTFREIKNKVLRAWAINHGTEVFHAIERLEAKNFVDRKGPVTSFIEDQTVKVRKRT